MFVTCLYLILNSTTGHICFANAGHNLPYLRTKDGVLEARATGMPLGLMPGMDYEENEITLAPGQHLLLSSDGLVEAHNPNREIFGFPKVKEIMAEEHNSSGLIEILLDELGNFTGEGYEQEDDITLLTIEHSVSSKPASTGVELIQDSTGKEEEGKTLGQFSFPSQPGGERQAAIKVVESLKDIELDEASRKRLETAVAEATLNAMEHGNHYQEDLPVEIRVFTSQDHLVVRIKDQGVGDSIPDSTQPDLDAKLAGEQSPRGWGLYLIKNMVDEMHTTQDETHHIVDLIINLV
jgi:anti-sigma regulatory factor (Ser/Thr protein kinase)